MNARDAARMLTASYRYGFMENNEMKELKKQIKEIIVRDLKLQGIAPEEIKDDAPLFEEGLGLDSLDAVELVVLVQKHFGVQIEDMDEGQAAFRSVETLAKFVTERRAAGA
jgi:acyl carrier protein